MTSLGRVGRYDILREIGRGGMATVYLAHQSELDRDVALKELNLASGPEPGDARRFLREARLAGSFNHPNIVTVHDYFEDGGRPYIAMEYMARGSLRPFVGRLSPAQVGGVLTGVLAGLAHAEERGVVHRDLKPENLMVTSQGGVKITDFGIAKATSSVTANLTTTGTTLGTPRYMSPERALGQELGPASDLYAVGVIAFELLVGHTPFHDVYEPMAVLLKQINDPVPPVISLVPDVGRPLSDWVARLLEKEPELRGGPAADAWDALDEILVAQLGPRWQRAAGLPDRPGGPTTSVRTPSAPTPRAEDRTPPTTPLAGGGAEDRDAPATPPRARFGDLDLDVWADRASPPGDATVAPSSVGRERPRSRFGVMALAAVGAILAFIFAADRVLDRGGGGSAGETPVVPRVSAQRADLSAASTASERERAASALADEYDRTAAGLRHEGEGGALLAAVERTAEAYRRAAGAARRDDGSDYDDAIASAEAGERAIKRAQRGAGDSQSDDPSDDEPDENEP